MENFYSCRKCDHGWLYKEDTVVKCECRIRYQEKVNKLFIIENSNIPSSIENYSIDSYIGPDVSQNIPKVKKYISEFEEKFNKVNLFVQGTNSCQKTTVISWLGLEIAKKGLSVHYILMNDLVKKLISSERDEELSEIIDKYLNCDLLIIDEAWDIQKVLVYSSQYQISFIDSFMRKRFNFQKSTIFISNIKVENIDNKFGSSLKELIKRSCSVLEFIDNINLKNDFKVSDIWGD